MRTTRSAAGVASRLLGCLLLSAALSLFIAATTAGASNVQFVGTIGVDDSAAASDSTPGAVPLAAGLGLPNCKFFGTTFAPESSPFYTPFALECESVSTATAVEYYYAAWNYYFETAFTDEIAALDGGAFGGVWQRTGQTFQVWPQSAGLGLPTCRFFSTTFAPKSSHFYTPFAAECEGVKVDPNWQYEGIAFYIQLADANGLCPPETIPLYRFYNNGMGGAPNHRYTTSVTVFDQMVAQGWVFEGNAITKVFACVPL